MPRRASTTWHDKFLDELAKKGTVTAACQKAGISRATALAHFKANAAFADRWRDAEYAVTDAIEQSVIERALNGSERLGQFLLRSRRPELYGDPEHKARLEREAQRINTEIVGALRAELGALAPDEKAVIDGILSRIDKARASRHDAELEREKSAHEFQRQEAVRTAERDHQRAIAQQN